VNDELGEQCCISSHFLGTTEEERTHSGLPISRIFALVYHCSPRYENIWNVDMILY
jgi:hypothetical protein